MSQEQSEAPRGPNRRIFQIHPTLRCNLRCRHCYSESGPGASLGLVPDVLKAAISDSCALGYEVVSVSGGEPFAYDGLADVLSYAKTLGMKTTVTTNGTLFHGGRLEAASEFLDGVAVSLDGPPELHNAMRASPTAFDRLLRGIEALRALSVPFGIINTLTRANWSHLPWVAQFAVDHGAGVLQVHPLELVGRANSSLRSESLQEETAERAYLMARVSEVKYAERLPIQLDLLLRRDILAHPELIYVGSAEVAFSEDVPANCLGSLVLEADGTVVPVSYGFSRRYSIGDLRESTLLARWPRWKAETYPAFRSLCCSVFAEIKRSDAMVVPWHELIVERSHGPERQEVAGGIAA
jgi:MoaA/NifB/PqqE/SkfB family radical SAM enzyme